MTNAPESLKKPEEADLLAQCPACGYSLIGLPVKHRCPECGQRFDRRSQVSGRRSIWARIRKYRGREITWSQAMLLTGLWFVLASVIEAVPIAVLAGQHAFFDLYLIRKPPINHLLCLLISIWIVVLGHFISMIVAGIVHRSWKIVLLYIGIPVFIAIVLNMWLHAGIGKMMAAI